MCAAKVNLPSIQLLFMADMDSNFYFKKKKKKKGWFMHLIERLQEDFLYEKHEAVII
jgi:hypothetical protein